MAADTSREMVEECSLRHKPGRSWTTASPDKEALHHNAKSTRWERHAYAASRPSTLTTNCRALNDWRWAAFHLLERHSPDQAFEHVHEVNASLVVKLCQVLFDDQAHLRIRIHDVL